MIGVVAAIVAVAFIGLGRWGQRNLETLVGTRGSADRRAKDLRSMRRGARSCLVIGALFAVFSVVATAGAIVGSG